MSAWLCWDLGIELSLLLPVAVPHHVYMLSESIIHKAVWLTDIKCRVPGVHSVSNQGKLLGGKGKALGEGTSAHIGYEGIFKN